MAVWLATLVAPALAGFPGANGLIAFNSDRSGNFDIWVVEADGSGLRNLTRSPENDFGPQWSPDGSRIVFVREGGDDDVQVWVMNADGSGQTPLTTGAEDYSPSWSPDGQHIVLASDRPGKQDIYVMNADGSGLQNLTNSPEEEFEPQWSPDGTRMVFRRGDGSEREIWTMDPDGGGQTQLTFNDAEDEDPGWAPDGTRVVFESDRDGGKEIYVMNADGSNPTRLTTIGEDGENDPEWSPDGSQVVFKSDRDGNAEIYVMNADGSGQTRVTDDPAEDSNPSWQPVQATTTTIAATTTTTTLPGAGGIDVVGKKLLLKDKPGKPQKRVLKLVGKDAGIGAGAENGSAGDPTLHGGFLKVVSAGGDGFNTTYDLPATSWRTKGKPGKNKGYKLKNAGPIKTVLVKLGKTLKVVAKGAALGHTLGADPKPVHVALGLGSQVYCLTFGGQTKFKPGKTYVAKKASAPETCEALLPHCGDGLLEEGESCPTLEGPVDGPAVDAVSTYHAEIPIPPAANDVDETGRALVRTRIEVVFVESTTVGQLRALLGRLGARISSMLRGVRSVVIDVPDPGGVPALDALVTDVEADPVVEMVLKAYEPRAEVLPPNFVTPLDATAGPRLDHHLAVRAAAAWNARAAMRGGPTVAVLDYFGNGAPDAALDAVAPAADFATATLNEHGYHVAGIIAARFGGDAAGRGQATGMLPGTASLRVVDMEDPNTSFLDEMNLAIEALASGAPTGVLNTSLGSDCNTPFGDLVNAAYWWAYKVRQMGLEDHVLHLTAAGNIDGACPAEVAADISSYFTAASKVPLPIPNLTNVLVVENALNDAGPAFAPRCLAPTSKTPGDLAGIGTAVWSLTRATTGAGNKTGTSMATPQVAGLAAYLWSLDPTLSVQDLRGLLLATRRPVPAGAGQLGCSAQNAAPIIDAYAAVLALDQAATPTPVSAPIRFALLDVDDDGDFDGDDLFEWSTILISGVTDQVQEPTDPEYQRYDLNGDGWTGGAARREAFDLDRVGSTRYGASQLGEVTQDVDGLTVSFDETAVNDLDVLCYYAYSDLYGGTEEARRTYLGARRCSRLEMAVDFASEIQPGLGATLTVSIGRPTATGSEPVEDVYVELNPAGGTATPASGTTDAQGELQSQIDLDVDSAFVEVVVQALTGPGGEVLAEEVVSAGAPCTDPPTMVDLDFGNGEPDPTVAGPTLQNGAEYRIRASGTFSIWTSEWQGGTCKGTPEGGMGGPTGLDAEYWFAIPNGSALCSAGFECCPNGHGKFQISLDGGGSFDEGEPVVGTYNPSHVYDYRVRGRGQPVHFKLEESSARDDDYGVLQLDVECANATTTTTTTSTTTSTTTTTTTSVSTTSVSPTSVSSTSVSTTSVSSTSVPSTSVPTTSSTSTTIFVSPVVPYRRYDATGPDGPVVTLGDEFTTETVDLGTVILDLPPVTIDGLLPPDPGTHQTCYAHPGGIFDGCIDIQDRFGLAPLRIGNPVGLCVPELFPSIAVDAFKCYEATGTALDLGAMLGDEFQSQAVTVGAPELLCTPAEVDGDPLQDAGRYLVCYATTPAGAAGGQIMVENALHPGAIQVDVGAATGLCVPALRQLVTSCDLCGNGVIDAAAGEECDDGNVTDGDGCSAVCRTEGP